MADLIPQGDTTADLSQQPAPDTGVGADALAKVAAPGAHAKGTAQDANDAIQDANPEDPQEVSGDEQAEYDQFTSRFRLIVSDMTDPAPDDTGKQGQSMNATIMAQLNNPKVPLTESIGKVTANIAMMIVNNARAQKITYQPDVLFHASVECVMMVYLLGSAAGMFKGVPPFRGLDEDGTYDFDDQELHIVAEAQMQAVRYFGTMEMKAGSISPEVRQANMEFWKQQVDREVASGNVNQDVIQKIQDMLPKQGEVAQGQDQGQDQTQQPLQQTAQQPPQQPAEAPAPQGMPGSTPPGGGIA